MAKRVINFRVSEEEYLQWSAYAAAERRTLSDFIRWVMQWAGAHVADVAGAPLFVKPRKPRKKGKANGKRKKA